MSAFLFPGQGSQSVGMLSELAEVYPLVTEIFAQASDVLGFDLFALVRQGPEEKLNQTAVTQPAMLTAGYAVWSVWREEGGANPLFMAGHSLGEYTAYVCAEAIPFQDAVKLVATRGELMQAAVPVGEGAMAAILGLDNELLAKLCLQGAQQEVVEPVNFNAPGQTVIAGHAAAIERVLELAAAEGAKRAIKLPVSVPSHCALMKPAAAKLAEHLAQVTITKPKIPVINNVDVEIYDDPAAIRDSLVRQLHSPVRWVNIVERLADEGVSECIECGPGKVLAGLVKRIDKSLSATPIFDSASVAKALG